MMDLTNNYINQGDSSVKSLKFKNNTTIGMYGCGVSSFSMLVAYKQKITGADKLVALLKEVLAKIPDVNGNLVYGNFEKNIINGIKYKCVQIDSANIERQIAKGNPVVIQIPGHFVLAYGIDESKKGFERILVKDPGRRTNTCLQQSLNDYKANTIKKCFILE